jgi:N-alpha-acetyltransferase 15/16, NatA auxiliary subunit
LCFQKDAASAGADLEDMQSLLYLIEEGDAHNRNRHFGLALKKYVAVQKVCEYMQHSIQNHSRRRCNTQIFDEVDDDQYDFHGYSLRKFTVNIYFE